MPTTNHHFTSSAETPNAETDLDTEAAEDHAEPEGAATPARHRIDNPSDTDPTVTDQRSPRPATRLLIYTVLPVVALALVVGAGYLKWLDGSTRADGLAQNASLHAAKDTTVAMLSYESDKVADQLHGAQNRLTGAFGDSYASLIKDVVIPGAQQKHISTTATVPAAAPVSGDATHAVALLFVNQTTTIGTDAPTDTTSAVKVTLDKVGDRWLVSGFDPV